MGSRSTYLRGGIGGIGGRALKAGDVLEAGDLFRADEPATTRRPRAAVRGRSGDAGGSDASPGEVTRQIAGRRVTDAATLDVMKMVIAGKLNVDLCAILGAAGIAWVALVSVVISAMTGVYRTALYRYAVDGEAPPAFAGTDLGEAFRAPSN